jgi:hypothetical protein
MTQPISSKLSTLQSTRKFSTKTLKMLPTKIESVNDLVEEQPKHNYADINVIWVETYLGIRPAKNKEIQAKFIVPQGYSKKILHRMVRVSWKATEKQKELKTAHEQGKFWQEHLQKYISINREFMS